MAAIVGGYAYGSGVISSSGAHRERRLLVGDACALMSDVVSATRNGRLTSLLAALHHDAALLYVSRHVLNEIARELPKVAQRVKHAVDPELAVHYWRTLYAPCVRVVDVPDSWGRILRVCWRLPSAMKPMFRPLG